MFTKFSNTIHKISSVRLLILLIIITFAIEAVFVLKVPQLSEQSGGGVLLDSAIWHSVDFTYQQLESYAGLPVYRTIRTADFFFPAAYALMLAVLSAVVYRKKYDNPSNYSWVLAVPLAGALLDYIENILLVILAAKLPQRLDAAAAVLNYVTLLKFAALGLSVLLIVTGALSLIKGGDSGLIIGNKFKGPKNKS